jgi:hypothetical protein
MGDTCSTALRMTTLRPTDADDIPASLFEEWMGMTAQEWEELGAIHDDEDEPRLF